MWELHVGGEVVTTTPEHPFFVKPGSDAGRGGWTPAGELRPGDLLATATGEWLPLKRVDNTGRVTRVYNLRVADYHTYFVAPASCGFDLWVHNTYRANARMAVQDAIESGELSVVNASTAGATRGTHQHHLFPQEHRALFAKGGIDVDDFVVDVPASIHGAIHGGADWQLARRVWSDEWNARILRELMDATRRNGGRLAPSQIQEIGLELSTVYGLGTDYHRYSRALVR